MQKYEGREAAGRVLAGELQRLKLGPCVVAGLPEDGMSVARPIASALHAPLTVIHTMTLCVPSAPDQPFGAADEDGHAVLDYRSVIALGLGEAEIERAKSAAACELLRRREGDARPRLRMLLPRTLVVVDDALGSGLNMQAAVAYALRQGVEAVVVAVPCASERAAYEMRSLLKRPEDRFVCPIVDPGFRCAEDYYLSAPEATGAAAELHVS